MLARAPRIYDATSDDLSAFKARDGTLLIWHRWADGAIMATSSIGCELATHRSGGVILEMRLEVVVLPALDVDRAKRFYPRFGREVEHRIRG